MDHKDEFKPPKKKDEEGNWVADEEREKINVFSAAPAHVLEKIEKEKNKPAVAAKPIDADELVGRGGGCILD